MPRWGLSLRALVGTENDGSHRSITSSSLSISTVLGRSCPAASGGPKPLHPEETMTGKAAGQQVGDAVQSSKCWLLPGLVSAAVVGSAEASATGPSPPAPSWPPSASILSGRYRHGNTDALRAPAVGFLCQSGSPRGRWLLVCCCS